MKSILLPLALILLAGCAKDPAPKTEPGSQAPPSPTASAPTKQDVSTEALSAIDPMVRTWDAKITKQKQAYEASSSVRDRDALTALYVKFGDYLTYESNLSPRQGKYHRALLEYRQALKLDPENSKAKQEIAQIEDIYKSMNRPIPGDEAAH